MSSNSKERESDNVQLQYVDEKGMCVAVGPSRSDNWNSQKEKLKASYLAEKLRLRDILTSLRVF